MTFPCKISVTYKTKITCQNPTKRPWKQTKSKMSDYYYYYYYWPQFLSSDPSPQSSSWSHCHRPVMHFWLSQWNSDSEHCRYSDSVHTQCKRVHNDMQQDETTEQSFHLHTTNNYYSVEVQSSDGWLVALYEVRTPLTNEVTSLWSCLLFCVFFSCSISQMFWFSCQYLPSDWLERQDTSNKTAISQWD